VSRRCSPSVGLATALAAFKYLYLQTCTAVYVHTQALMLTTFEIVNLSYRYASSKFTIKNHTSSFDHTPKVT